LGAKSQTGGAIKDPLSTRLSGSLNGFSEGQVAADFQPENRYFFVTVAQAVHCGVGIKIT
jgi:hypothetical protein